MPISSWMSHSGPGREQDNGDRDAPRDDQRADEDPAPGLPH